MKSASILRARKSSAVLKIRKGTPVVAKLTLRKKDLQLFYYRLLYQVLPQLNTFKVPSSLEKNKEFVITIKITDIFLFPELRPFYFYLNKYNDLRLLLKINKSLAKIAPKFLFSLFEFPVKY
jgi:ribosomal protein L5